jgi:hypothetical protein
MDLKEKHQNDKRGLANLYPDWVEQIADNLAILTYYGQGDVHEAIYSYDESVGWKWEKYYDREWEKLTPEEKATKFQQLVDGFKKAGLTDVKESDGIISFSRPNEAKNNGA